MKKAILLLMMVSIYSSFCFAQSKIEGPPELGDTYKIKLYKDKCTDGKCKDGGTGTLRFKTYGTIKEFTGTFGEDGTFANGLLTFLDGNTYQGSFKLLQPDNKYAKPSVMYDSGTYIKKGSFTYTAKFLNNIPEGNTVIQYDDGAKYVGSLHNGFFDGYGKMNYKGGLIYEGEWKQGYRHGKGIFKDSNHPQYFFSGIFKDNYPNGIGITVTNDSPDTLSGNFVSGYKHGFIKKTSPNGTVVWQKYKVDTLEYDHLTKIDSGYCVNGNCKTGKGKMFRSDGVLFEGDIKNGMADGMGTFTFKDGTHTGEAKNNKRNGVGKTVWSDGHFYVGNYKDDIRSGEGTMQFSENEYYKGHFENGRYNGLGKFHFKDGSTYEGNYTNDTLTGNGTYLWNSGSSIGAKYTGNFKDGKLDGKGVYYFANGNVFDGVFAAGQLYGAGTLTKSNGEKYTSDFWLGQTFVKGKKINGQTEIEGEYNNDQFFTLAEATANEEKQAELKKLANEVVGIAKKRANLARDQWVQAIEWDCLTTRKYYIYCEAQTKYHQYPFAGHVMMQVIAPDNTVAWQGDAGDYWTPRMNGKYIFLLKFYQDKILGDQPDHTNYVSGMQVIWTMESKLVL